MKNTVLACVATVMLSACGGGGTNADANEPDNTASESALAGWQLVWQDEFNRDGLPDSTKWDYDTEFNQRGWWNGELQYYSRERTENARVENGKLIITARQERLSSAPDYGNQNYTSARLITRGKGEWTYGRFEIRAKLPCALGTWPAIWTLGTGGVWPNDGEIDIMEQKGFSTADKQQVLGTLHMGALSGGAGPSAVRSLPNACTAFNTYHMTWNASQIAMGVNGVDFHTYRNPNDGNDNYWPFDRPQYLLLNVAVGGNLGGPVLDQQLPASMEVDWVRVYRRR